MLGDSECTLASIEKTSGALGEYFGNRVGEILDNQAKMQEICPVGNEGEWYHVSSDDNAADKPTRVNSTHTDILPDSTWQRGPSYLYTPTSTWPIDRDFALRKEACIPENEILRRYRGIINNVTAESMHNIGIHNLIDPNFTNDWDRLIERTLYFLYPFLQKRAVYSESTRLAFGIS